MDDQQSYWDGLKGRMRVVPVKGATKSRNGDQQKVGGQGEKVAACCRPTGTSS
jgi:hypothetical protein